ncbi:aldo/keto reductase [Calidifontibacter terrae]
MTVDITTDTPTVELHAGPTSVTMPQLGFGVWQVEDAEATPAVAEALRVGYRSIDTARIYGNESGVGRALADNAVNSDEVFVTTKIWNDDQGMEQTLAAFDASIARLDLGRPLDLLLIHWPTAAKGKFIQTYEAMMQLREEGRVRAIGVCNFTIDNLTALHDAVGEYPAINQVELHPDFNQADLRAFHADHGIVTEAWSPLGQGGDLLHNETIADIARQVGRTPAQVIIRWHLQTGNVVIPKSVTPSRIAENFDVFGFELSAPQLAAIDALPQGERMGPDPDTFGV